MTRSHHHHDLTPTSRQRVDPGPAAVGGAVASAARADILAVPVTLAPGGHAHALTANAEDGSGRADEDLVDAIV